MNGRIVGFTNERQAGSLVVYSCNFGYRLLTGTARQCLLNGSWSQQNPTCEGKTTKLYVCIEHLSCDYRGMICGEIICEALSWYLGWSLNSILYPRINWDSCFHAWCYHNFFFVYMQLSCALPFMTHPLGWFSWLDNQLLLKLSTAAPEGTDWWEIQKESVWSLDHGVEMNHFAQVG